MIKNAHQLNVKELELTQMISDLFAQEIIGNIDAYVDYSKPPKIEFRNELAVLHYLIRPKDAECEEQLQIPTILWDVSIRRQGLFKKLMAVLVKFCNKYEQMPIIFTDTVPSFANLLKSHGGIELGDDNIAILPEKWRN